MTQPGEAIGEQPEQLPPAGLRTVLQDQGPVALATRIHVPDRIVAQLRDAATIALPAGVIRERVRRAAREHRAWSAVTDTGATLDVDGLASCILVATPLLGRDDTRASGWLLRIDACDATIAPADEPAGRARAIDVLRDVDAAPLRATFAGALSELVEPSALDPIVTAWLVELSASWAIESPTGPSGVHLVEVGDDLRICLEVLDAGAAHPLRARLEPAAPEPGRLLEVVLPGLDADSLVSGPAGVPAVFEHMARLPTEEADRVIALVAGRVDRDLRALSEALLAGVDLAAQPAALCRREWRLEAGPAAGAVAEVLAAGGVATRIERLAGSLPSWSLRGTRAGARLCMQLGAARLSLDDLHVDPAPGCVRAGDLAHGDGAFAPGTLIALGDPVLDAALPPSRGDRAVRRRRLEEALAAAGSLRAGPSPATAHISVGDTLTFVATRADTREPRLDVDRMQTVLESAWREYRNSWIYSVRFSPGVREGVREVLGLQRDSEVESALMRLAPRLGIDHPPAGRPDVALWIALEVPGGDPPGERTAHLALVADATKVWAQDSVVAAGFVAAPELGLPSPGWLRNATVALPSVADLLEAAGARHPERSR